MLYSTSDKLNYNIYELWTTQTIKAIFLFQFLERQTKTQPLLAAFLLYFNCKTWQEYLKRLLPLTSPAIQNKNESHTDITVQPGDNFEEGCAFIEKLIVKDDEQLEEYDFLSIRTKPFYKIKDGVYRIIFNLFVVEKIFKGVYFLMRDVNNKLPKEQKVTDLKSFFGDEISEKILLYEILKIIYPKCIHFSGKDLADMNIIGAVDYYIRKGKNILLFESKDFLIPVAVKDSCDFLQYEKEFMKKLYFDDVNGKQKHKAVMQLVNNIRRLLKKEFKADTDYHYREVSIYPVLITHDHQYETGGFNNLINYWFQEELQDLDDEGLYTRKVKPLVVVNIDCLIYHQVALQNNISLHEVLSKYIEQIHIIPGIKFPSQQEAEQYILSKLTPFSIFIGNYFSKLKLKKMSPMLKELGLSLFNENAYKSEIII